VGGGGGGVCGRGLKKKKKIERRACVAARTRGVAGRAASRSRGLCGV
jgi:hypothetical protein